MDSSSGTIVIFSPMFSIINIYDFHNKKKSFFKPHDDKCLLKFFI